MVSFVASFRIQDYAEYLVCYIIPYILSLFLPLPAFAFQTIISPTIPKLKKVVAMVGVRSWWAEIRPRLGPTAIEGESRHVNLCSARFSEGSIAIADRCLGKTYCRRNARSFGPRLRGRFPLFSPSPESSQLCSGPLLPPISRECLAVSANATEKSRLFPAGSSSLADTSQIGPPGLPLVPFGLLLRVHGRGDTPPYNYYVDSADID